MIALPVENYYTIFYNLQYDYNALFSCALVNRQWCRIIIPILWSEPRHHFKDPRLMRILLLTLNIEEQTSLILFNITFPNQKKPLFEYTSYITSITYDLHYGVRNYLRSINPNIIEKEIRKHAIKRSLITMLLRTSKNLKYLYLDEIIRNRLIYENLYEKTTITSVNLCFGNDNIDVIKHKAIIDGLIKFLNKNSTLTSLNLKLIRLGIKDMELLLESLYKNPVLKSLGLYSNEISTEEEWKLLVKFLCKKTTLTSLALSGNNLESEIRIIEPIFKNTTLTSINLGCTMLGSEG
ncbi:hypothetical protein C2G38_2213586 [Gigaspora rosea]|uniref:Uncharacterized protein n=1 Tax=Gigaspora rosea TaxID=44941 RepID=A0A397UEW3_9GLOM|nr:hypothetical protein C2G38_2213586 [Gigaspora rosea]